MKNKQDFYTISTNKTKLNISLIHHYLSVESYWAKNIPLNTVKTSIKNSICFGVYNGSEQVGFARVITDKATFAYLADVFIVEPHRKKGLSKKLMKYILNYKKLKGLRRFMLATLDAHELYRKYGFSELRNPERMMEINIPDIYTR